MMELGAELIRNLCQRYMTHQVAKLIIQLPDFLFQHDPKRLVESKQKLKRIVSGVNPDRYCKYYNINI